MFRIFILASAPILVVYQERVQCPKNYRKCENAYVIYAILIFYEQYKASDANYEV